MCCRVEEQDSLFDGYCQATESQSAVFCDCALNSVSVCGRGRDVFQCGKTDTAQREEVEEACNRSKRSCGSSKRSRSGSKPSRGSRGGSGSGSGISSQEQDDLNSQTAEQDKGQLYFEVPCIVPVFRYASLCLDVTVLISVKWTFVLKKKIFFLKTLCKHIYFLFSQEVTSQLHWFWLHLKYHWSVDPLNPAFSSSTMPPMYTLWVTWFVFQADFVFASVSTV